MQLYDRGIRRRLAPMLNGDQRRLELAYSLLFSLPGTPVIRYGDEIGMGDDLSLPERNCARTPMQWSTEPNAGFTRAKKPTLPVIASGAYAYDRVNAAEQRRDPQSLLNWTERMIRMRKEVPEFGWGDFKPIETQNPGVLALRYSWRNNDVLTLHNLRDEAIEVDLRLDGEAGKRLVSLFDHEHSDARAGGRHRLVLKPYGYVWYRMGGLGYILDRKDE
jgi:maltose alpha-D-glucosyltransferase/alpha-amylase